MIKLYQVLILKVSLVAMLILTACDMAAFGSAIPSIRNVPFYPSPQQLKQRTIVVSDPRKTVNVTSFQTSDKVPDVLALYKDALMKQGWHVENVAIPYVTGQNTIYFRYSNSTKACISFYGVDVVVNSVSNGLSSVEVQTWAICGTA